MPDIKHPNARSLMPNPIIAHVDIGHNFTWDVHQSDVSNATDLAGVASEIAETIRNEGISGFISGWGLANDLEVTVSLRGVGCHVIDAHGNHRILL